MQKHDTMDKDISNPSPHGPGKVHNSKGGTGVTMRKPNPNKPNNLSPNWS